MLSDGENPEKKKRVIPKKYKSGQEGPGSSSRERKKKTIWNTVTLSSLGRAIPFEGETVTRQRDVTTLK